MLCYLVVEGSQLPLDVVDNGLMPLAQPLVFGLFVLTFKQQRLLLAVAECLCGAQLMAALLGHGDGLLGSLYLALHSLLCVSEIAQQGGSIGRLLKPADVARHSVKLLFTSLKHAILGQQVVDGRHKIVVIVAAGQQARKSGYKAQPTIGVANHKHTQHLATAQLVVPLWLARDVIIYAACGKRGKRVGHIVERPGELLGQLNPGHSGSVEQVQARRRHQACSFSAFSSCSVSSFSSAWSASSACLAFAISAS